MASTLATAYEPGLHPLRHMHLDVEQMLELGGLVDAFLAAKVPFLLFLLNLGLDRAGHVLDPLVGLFVEVLGFSGLRGRRGHGWVLIAGGLNDVGVGNWGRIGR